MIGEPPLRSEPETCTDFTPLTAFDAAVTIPSGDFAATPLSEAPPHPAMPPARAAAHTANVEMRI